MQFGLEADLRQCSVSDAWRLAPKRRSRPFADIGNWHSERPHWVYLSEEPVVTRFERGRLIRSWQPKRDGECNEALDTFVYAHAPRL